MRRISLFGQAAVIAALLVVGSAGPQPTLAAENTQVVPPTGMAPGQNSGTMSDLRTDFNRLLSEHTALAGIVTQKAATGAPDFSAAFDHLDQNSVLLSQLIGSLYGPDAQAQFLPLWRAHTQMYVDYTQATGRMDMAARDQIRTALNQWIQAQAEQFAGLNPNLAPSLVAPQLATHVNGTLAAIDTFAQGDFQQHYDIMHQAFEHSFTMGNMMATAIAQQFPGRFAIQAPVVGR